MLGPFPRNRRAFYLVLVCAVTSICFINLLVLTHTVDDSVIRLPNLSLFTATTNPVIGEYAHDEHPIGDLMKEANREWLVYDNSRSTNFRRTVAKYREKYGRHPPPGFKEWYMFARKKKAHNVDDFQQITGDLRPFWAVPPAEIRQMAAGLQASDGIAGVQIRNKKVVHSPVEGWRVETLRESINRIVQYLPDMDIALNIMDQPRVMVSFEETQEFLRTEALTRSLPNDAQDRFTPDMNYLYKKDSNIEERADPSWTSIAGKLYMDFAKESCDPHSPARNENFTLQDADKLYKSSSGGFVTNFTASSDLCTVGPVLGKNHGFLFSASSNLITRKLMPVFSECKVSVNNDILFPANMYFLDDKRYVYNSRHDYEWQDKADTLIWRGVTSGGVQLADNWQHMHRQRFVHITNGTEMSSETVSILSETKPGQYRPYPSFNPSNFSLDHFDVGFTEAWGCIPNCSFYDDVWTYKDPKDFSEQFKAKYLVDIDGHSFSGRWRAFQLSKSLGIKATIFREWHDSRLFPWRHFVPMDNRYDDLYGLMTYFLGLDSPASPVDALSASEPHMKSHDFEAEVIASQSREWAQHALRNEDLDIYLYLLLLEYGRIIDDNRDSIGYSGDGSELDDFDDQYPFSPAIRDIVTPPLSFTDEQ
ncbi:Lipopolysaccharide-modifying protein [Penicillium coprophilum]|uniref:Lipopolysaccharide-modifying protein n=1 Tax=Penicillium coprophilum TaxID=36646 RepID=UPI00238E86F1|nr:Lipopolysaccharide-modifying protein [Penicillium coprophilum]KAJ5154925.1 Lipopolysaccharide-modifying protein [Penicillium coprophilum]